MHRFIPPPIFPSEWWQELDISPDGVDPYTATDLVARPLDADTWTACALWTGEFGAPPAGYLVFLPTASDCLMWLRWVVLAQTNVRIRELPQGTMSRDVRLEGDASALARIVDSQPDGTFAASVLRSIETQSGSFGEWQVHSFRSIHEVLAEAGSLQAWRTALGSDRVEYSGETWSMPAELWEGVREQIMSAGLGCGFELE